MAGEDDLMPWGHEKTERNAEILCLALDGFRYREIAERFGIVTSRVGCIVKMERRRQLESPETEAFVRKIRAANSLDKAILVEPLINAFGMRFPVTRATLKHFSKKGYEAKTLRQLMDFFIPEQVSAGISWEDIPARNLCHGLRKTYAYVLARLSSVDLGKAFEEEWQRRKSELVNADWFVPLVLGG